MKKTAFLLLVVASIIIFTACPTEPAAPGVDKDITNFGFYGVNLLNAKITGDAVELTVPYGTDPTALVAVFISTGVSVAVEGVEQVSGTTVNDFSSPVTYTVTAEDASTIDFVVTVTVELGFKSFKFLKDDNSELVADIIGSISGYDINLWIDYSTNVDEIVNAIIPAYEGSDEQIEVNDVEQFSGINSNDFSSPVIYKITAEDGRTAEYTVNVYIPVNNLQLREMISNEKNVTMADTSSITNMSMLFNNNTDFNQDISRWDVSNVVDMNGMFAYAEAFNQDISRWDVSNVVDMEGMFIFAAAFDQDISRWDVSNVVDMNMMFASAVSFNQDIGNWDVSNVRGMSSMFATIYYQIGGISNEFNQNIGSWDVSNVTNMSGMFSYATAFNQPISNWDVSNVTDMRDMFLSAKSFNQDLSGWDVSRVTDMASMFSYSISFNKSISGWDVSGVTDMSDMFNEAKSFNQNLSGWDVDYTDDDRTAAVTHTDFSTNWGGGIEPVWVP